MNSQTIMQTYTNTYLH